MGTQQKTGAVAVSMRALIQRINRQLRKQDQTLKTTRGGRARFDVGDYYVIDVRRNLIVDKHVDPEELGRELGVLAPYERLVED